MDNKPTFDMLIEKHGKEIYSYLWRLLYDPADADDCFQDVFLRAFTAYPRLKATSNYRAWLYRIAINTSNTFRRRRGRLAGRTTDLDPEIHSNGQSPADLVDQALSLARVRKAVDNLPKKQRAALLLRKYQRLSYTEIANALSCSTESARSNVYQALKKLRRELVPLEDTPVGDDR